MDEKQLVEKILELKKERDATIVAHYYQAEEIQKIADMVGDSFALARYCAKDTKKVIVFCGVKFMAEGAHILSPEKTVLLPALNALCPLAEMADAEGLRRMKEKYPNAAVVSYVNTTAEVKALSDICCTSSNAVKVIRSLEEKDIIFLPDCNLASYIAGQVPEKNIIRWPGHCIVHHRLTAEDVRKARESQPEAEFLAHPECPEEVTGMADFVGSTKGIIEYATASSKKTFLIGTEMGILYELKRRNPDKQFYMLTPGLVCVNMKKTTLQNVYEALRDMKHVITVPPEIREKAEKALRRMIEIG